MGQNIERRNTLESYRKLGRHLFFETQLKYINVENENFNNKRIIRT